MEIKYLDSPRKTSFIGEGREIDEANEFLEQFNNFYKRKVTLSDILRICVTRFNEEESFRNELLNKFKPKGVVSEEESQADSMFS